MIFNKRDDFLSKFSDRIEKVGRDGIMGLMKSTGIPINNLRQNLHSSQKFNSFRRKNVFKEIDKNFTDNTTEQKINNSPKKTNTYISSKQLSFRKKVNQLHQFNPITCNNQNNFANKENNLIHSYNMTGEKKNTVNFSNNMKLNSILDFSPTRNFPTLSTPQPYISGTQGQIHTVANNKQNIFDFGYTPYTLKDYKKISNVVNMGKLGPNIGTEEWEKKRDRMKKMSDYGNKVIFEGKGCKVKLGETPDERQKKIKEMKILNGKWNIINEYSRGLFLNTDKNNNEMFKKNVNNKLNDEERLIDQKFQSDMEKEVEEERILQKNKNELYQQRLNNMKNLLFN